MTKKTDFLLPVALTVLHLPFLLTAAEKWNPSQDAVSVIGQEDFTSNTSGLSDRKLNQPNDVSTDAGTGKVFIADFINHRVMRWASVSAYENGEAAEAVLGQPDFETADANTSATGMNSPIGVEVDGDGILWVADTGNNRILRFDSASEKVSGAAADGVLGQSDFDSSGNATTPSGLNSPQKVAIDSNGNVFVADTGNSRILVFLDAANAMNGTAASIVLGQENFTSPGVVAGQDGVFAPRGVAIDSMDNLFVADTGNNRVLRFDSAATKSSGDDADGVLGQQNFTDTSSDTTSATFKLPYDVALDRDDRLWVVDTSNFRILGFTGAAGLPDGSEADLVLCQDDFTSSESGTAVNRMSSGRGVGVSAAGEILVADFPNHRILVFAPDIYQPDFRIGKTSSTANKGNNKYNTSGSGQKKTYVLKKSKAKLTAKLENESTVPETFAIKAKGTTRKFKINVYTKTGGRKNITGSSKRGTYVTTEVAPGGSFNFSHEIKPKGKFKKKKASINAWIQGTAQTVSEVDRVVSKVKHRPKK